MSECRGTVALIENVVDPGQLSASEAATIAQNHVGEIEITLAQPMPPIFMPSIRGPAV